MRLCFMVVLLLSFCMGHANALSDRMDYKIIPENILSVISYGQSLDAFREKIYSYMSMYHQDEILLDKNKLSARQSEAAKPFLRRLDAMFERYDFNKDSMVTYEEVYNYHRTNSQALTLVSNEYKYLYDKAKKYFLLDTNGDGGVSYQEAMTLNDAFLESREYADHMRSIWVLEELFALDPNGDNKLYSNEVEQIIRDVFSGLDENNNQVLEHEELSAYRDWLNDNKKYFNFSKAHCPLFDNYNAPDDTVVFVAMGIAGEDTNLQFIDGNGKVGRFKVEIAENSRPVVLILLAEEASIWDISLAPKTTVHTIISRSRNVQVINGDVGDAHIIRINQDTVDKACDFGEILANSLPDLRYLNQVALSILGKPVDNVIPMGAYNDYQAKFGPLEAQFVPIQDIQVQDRALFSRTTPFVGKVGLDYALKNNFIRSVTQDEVDKWNLARAQYEHPRLGITQYTNLKDIPFMRASNDMYTILVSDYVVPLGVKVRFFVPKGVRPPFVGLSQATVFDMNTTKCFSAVSVKGRHEAKPQYEASPELMLKNLNVKSQFLDDAHTKTLSQANYSGFQDSHRYALEALDGDKWAQIEHGWSDYNNKENLAEYITACGDE